MIRIQIPDFFEVGIPMEPGDLRERALVNLSWVLNCWLAGIATGYSKGAPRRVEVNRKIQALCNELRPQITDDEWHRLRKGMLDEETGEPYELD